MQAFKFKAAAAAAAFFASVPGFSNPDSKGHLVIHSCS